MPETSKHTNDLILRLTKDYTKSVRAKRMFSIALIALGIILAIFGNSIIPNAGMDILKAFPPLLGVSVSASSFFPINDIFKLNLKIRTLELITEDLATPNDGSEEDRKRIEQIVWKLVEQTVTA